MALQFDGSGYVNFPQASLTGDFSISGEFEYKSDTQIILGLQGSTNHFLAVFPGRVQVRLSGDNILLDSASLADGQRYLFTVSRVGSTVTIDVAGIGIATGSSSSALNIDAFGRYSGSSFRYAGALYGEWSITGDAGGVRTYDFAQSPGSTVLPDTTSSQDGTLTAFTTGDFFAATPIAQPPTANAGIDQSVSAGATVQLDGTGSTAVSPATIASYTWTQTAGDAVTLTNANTATPTYTAPDTASPQTVTHELVVTDSEGLSSNPDSVSVDVAANTGTNFEYDIILLVGQSNMVGRRGPIDPVLDATDSRIMQYGTNNQVLELAADPLDHWDAGADTVGPGLTLAKEYADNYLEAGRKVLLVPAARGGSNFAGGFWQSGGDGYTNAIARANEAIALNAGNKIVLIAWHQGESDNTMTETEYTTNLDALISGFRSSITGATACPFIVGEISPSSSGYGAGVAAALIDTPQRVSDTGYIQTADLALSGDGLHFIATSSRTMGVRYAQEYGSVIGATTSVSLDIGAPDGTFKVYLLDQSDNVVYNGNATFSGGSATISGLSVAAGTALEGYTIDNESPHVNGAVITGVTV